MNITFTQQEKELFLIKQGYIIDTVQGYIDDVDGQIDFPVKVAVYKGDLIAFEYQEKLTGKYYANIQTEYGIDVVFEREFKKRLMEVLK